MSHIITTDEETKLNLILLKNKGFQVEVYLGGKWGRFFYEKLVVSLVALYLLLVITAIGIQVFLYNKATFNTISQYSSAYVVLYIIIDLILALKVAPKIISIIKSFLFSSWNKFVENRPIKLYNFSDKPYNGSNAVFSQYNIPSGVLLGFYTSTDRIIFYDYFLNQIRIRGNGKFSKDDLVEIVSNLVKHLNLERNSFQTPWEISELDYIDTNLYKMYNKDSEVESKRREYNYLQQRQDDLENSSNHVLISIIWIIVMAGFSLIFSDLMLQSYDHNNLIEFSLSLSMSIFFIVNWGFSMTLLDAFNSEDSVYNT